MPPESRDQFEAHVTANTPICREHYRLVFSLPKFPSTRPGQFIQIECSDFRGDEAETTTIDWPDDRPPQLNHPSLDGPAAMLRRPFSLAGRRDHHDKVELEIIHRVVGIGTDWLSRLKQGDAVSILGPLGNAFQVPLQNGRAILVGGGVGIPPMLYLATCVGGLKTTAFVGALTRDLLPLTLTGNPSPDAEPLPVIKEFSLHNVDSVVTTDDGSLGFRGFVTQALERYLDQLSPQSSLLDTTIYTCGPELMMKRVAAIAADRKIECQVAVERAMACGMGTCQSCCIKVTKPDASQPPLAGSDWCYRLACTDGPIFRGADLLW